MKLKNKVAIIAGAGGGIGRATARLWAEEGAHVALIARSQNSIHETVQHIQQNKGNAIAINADLTQADQIQSAIKKIFEQWGSIDILFCNAGTFSMAPFENLNEKNWDEMFQNNLKTYFLTIQAALPYLKKNKSSSILLTAAIFGHTTIPKNLAHYNASKAGVIALTKSLAVEYYPDHIRVNCICPGQISHQLHSKIDTPITNNNQLKRGGLPEDIAFASLYFASDDSSWVTGSILNVDGGLSLGLK